MLCIFTMGNLAVLEGGPDQVVADQEEEKWWLANPDAPASHMYLQYWSKPYSGWELMSSKEWRRITKSLPNLWRDAYLQNGKNITVTEVVRDDDYTVYTVIIEDGDRYVRYRNLPGYSAKGVIFDEILGIENYQFYTTLVCQQTPIWDTVIRICRSKGAKVTRTTDGWTFES